MWVCLCMGGWEGLNLFHTFSDHLALHWALRISPWYSNSKWLPIMVLRHPHESTNLLPADNRVESFAEIDFWFDSLCSPGLFILFQQCSIVFKRRNSSFQCHHYHVTTNFPLQLQQDLCNLLANTTRTFVPEVPSSSSPLSTVFFWHSSYQDVVAL